MFDEALARYNEKQTRSDRRIDDYYGKICSGKQGKPFHEIILQIGDKDNMGAKTENGQLAVKVLDKYMQDFLATKSYVEGVQCLSSYGRSNAPLAYRFCTVYDRKQAGT